MAMMASTTMMTQFEMSIFFSFWTMLMLMTSAAMVNDGTSTCSLTSSFNLVQDYFCFFYYYDYSDDLNLICCHFCWRLVTDSLSFEPCYSMPSFLHG